MTQNEKDLLMKDLCARLPYKVYAQILNEYDDYDYTSLIENIDIDGFIVDFEGDQIEVEYIKPYLFPLSSMTEEQLEEFYCNFVENEIDFNDFKKYYFETNSYYKLLTSVSDCPYVIDWFIKNHFDYRGLIPMRLAIDATELNIY